MTPLGHCIQQEIAATGPIPVARYMALCLSHPEFGYYTTKNPIGAAGDFTTAPEISQMFGEMLGIWLLKTWQDQGSPDPFVLVELGPGRGTLMLDILRVTKQDPAFSKAMQLKLVETSPALRKLQSSMLKNNSFFHLDALSDLPDMPILLVANEFFDALPICQYVFSDAGWQERLLGNCPEGFEILLSDPIKNALLDQQFPSLPNGVVVEISPHSLEIATEIGQRLRQFGGAALIIDYGDFNGIGDTFQAVKDHSSTDTLANQGQCDLTAHVQFQPLADAAETEVQFTTQGQFLEAMGIGERAKVLAKNASGKQVETLIGAYRRLVHADEMGTLFKVMALRSAEMPPTPGFKNAA